MFLRIQSRSLAGVIPVGPIIKATNGVHAAIVDMVIETTTKTNLDAKLWGQPYN